MDHLKISKIRIWINTLINNQKGMSNEYAWWITPYIIRINRILSHSQFPHVIFVRPTFIVRDDLRFWIWKSYQIIYKNLSLTLKPSFHTWMRLNKLNKHNIQYSFAYLTKIVMNLFILCICVLYVLHRYTRKLNMSFCEIVFHHSFKL